ncbi:MAG: DUF3794 domain-containing protein [Oscillospiraceae bacterium]|nr:DUF3794 domain-containing protein [Oscillospiraceae bacterium]
MDLKIQSNSNSKGGHGSAADCLTTSKEPVFLNEVVYDGQVEQGVEFDYVLPDYYPDIFKVLKCSLTPCVVSYSVSGNQLYCDGVVYIKLLYLSRESNVVNCVEQRYTYSKTIDLVKPVENALAYISPKTDYCNCRAVSGRRIDIRGAVSCKVKVICMRESQMITGVSGMGVETLKTSLRYCGEKLVTSRQFVTRENIETGVGSGGINSIVHHDASVTVSDYKIISGKVVVKGEALIKALYLTKSTNGSGMGDYSAGSNANSEGESAPANLPVAEEAEVIEAVIPISQIIDLNGVSENHVCFVNLSVMDCDLEIKSSDVGENRVLSCDLTINCTVTAHLEKEVMPLIDMYSVNFESSFTKSIIKTETMPQIIERQLSFKGTVECSEGELEAVYDSRYDISNIVCRTRGENELVITGQANLQVVARLSTGTPTYIEKSEPFEIVTEVSGLSEFTEQHSIEPNLQVINTTYSISAENRVDIRAVLKLTGCLYQVRSIEVIKEVSVNEDAPKAGNHEYALKLYYAEENEDIWSIAKRYNTSAEAIIAENDMEIEQSGSDRITSPCMLLIPIV